MKGGRGSAAISPAECLFTIPIPGIPGDGRERQFIAPSADVQVLLPDCLEIGFRKPISSAPARGDNEASPLFPRITERRFHVRSFVGDDRRQMPCRRVESHGAGTYCDCKRLAHEGGNFHVRCQPGPSQTSVCALSLIKAARGQRSRGKVGEYLTDLPWERLANCRQRAAHAHKCAAAAEFPEVRDFYISIAMAWETLASEIEYKLEGERRRSDLT